ncbi:MAG: hypothetical protein AABZ53_02390 [Planctomycetota bacterium]
MEPDYPIVERNGMFNFMLRSCTARILVHILDRDTPFVWIRRHAPCRDMRWWRTKVPLSIDGAPFNVEARMLNFDLQMSTSEFLENIAEFDGHGLVLFQMSKRVPDSLTLDGIADDLVDRVLVQNGMTLRFYLPHAVECAQVTSPQRATLEQVLRRPEVNALAY